VIYCRQDSECKDASRPYCYDNDCVECFNNDMCGDGLSCNMKDGTCGTVYVIDCDAPFDIVTAPGTTIVSPNYPNDYGWNLDCQVTVNFEKKVTIVFEEFAVEDDSTCDDDWLEVHDGDSSDSDMIGEQLCGYDVPDPIVSTGNSMTLVFHSNLGKAYKLHSYKGFKIKTDPECIRDDQCNGEMVCLQGECRNVYVMDCEALRTTPFEVITTPNTTIISPNYPSPYSPYLDCQVTVNFQEKVSIVFEDFDTSAADEDCSSVFSDWLEVHDGDNSDSELIGKRLCGDDIPSPRESTGDSITLVFHTDYKNRHYYHKGFKIITF